MASKFDETLEILLEWFAGSRIIQLRHTRKEDTMERTIQITKIKEIKHSEQIHQLEFDSNDMKLLHPKLMP